MQDSNRQEKDHRPQILTLRVSDDEAQVFRLAAKAEGISLSELIRRAVRTRAERLTARPGKE